ncbi:PEP-CTERM sorting domain-containing protein [Planctomycetota bacterium]|nr:PEP-CTERM sorting domain-containing protein [Planctomycetota bacterium]
MTHSRIAALTTFSLAACISVPVFAVPTFSGDIIAKSDKTAPWETWDGSENKQMLAGVQSPDSSTIEAGDDAAIVFTDDTFTIGGTKFGDTGGTATVTVAAGKELICTAYANVGTAGGTGTLTLESGSSVIAKLSKFGGLGGGQANFIINPDASFSTNGTKSNNTLSLGFKGNANITFIFGSDNSHGTLTATQNIDIDIPDTDDSSGEVVVTADPTTILNLDFSDATVSAGDTFTLMTSDTAITGDFDAINVNGANLSASFDNGIVTLAAIPEPASMALLLTGTILLAARKHS